MTPKQVIPPDTMGPAQYLRAVLVAACGMTAALLAAGESRSEAATASPRDGSIVIGHDTQHVKQRGLMGCHIDLGYAHESRGVYAQLLHGESMESMALPKPEGILGAASEQAHAGLPWRPAEERVAPPSVCGRTTAVCFGVHDEMKIVGGVADAAACCRLCTGTTGCTTWTWRDTPKGGQCHLRHQWANSRPNKDPACTTGVTRPDMPLPTPSTPATTTQWIGLGVNISYTSERPFNGLQALRLGVPAGTSCAPGLCGAANRGFWQEGLSLASGRLYEGYVFARGGANAGDAVTLHISLSDSVSQEVVATASVSVPGDTQWRRYDFNLTASSGTTCVSYPFGKAPLFCEPGLASRRGHACLQCSGQLVFTVASGATVDLDMAYLAPGSWGRFRGLPAFAETVQNLQDMGVDAIRTGGTYVKTDVRHWAGLLLARCQACSACCMHVWRHRART